MVTIKDRTNQEVCRVFQRINSSGTSLSTLELLAAWTWSDQFDLRSEIETLIDCLADRGYEQLDDGLLMRCLAAVVLNRIEADELVDVAPPQLVDGMSKLKQAAYTAVDFMELELRIKNVVFIPFPIMLVPLVGFFSRTLKPTAAQLSALRRWFWHCAFTQKYKAGTNTAVMADLEDMKKLAGGTDAFATLAANIDPAMFKKTWRINSTVAKAAICMLAQVAPRSFLSGHTVDLGTAMAAYNSREFHHIYPKAHLATQGIPFHESNVIANVCFLTSADNRAISDADPRDYMAKIPSDLKPQIAAAALIPIDAMDGALPYADFVRRRSQAMAELANRLIKFGQVA